jgi:drug/metabolite transporter (DMT)-like permease
VFSVVFVLPWSTGFIAAKYGLPYAPPLKFLLYRFVLVAALTAVVALATRAPWGYSRVEVGHIAVSALLVHGVCLGGVFVAIARGMPAGIAALLVGLQPILTVVIARAWFGERVVPRQRLGFVLGLGGVWLVVRHKLAPASDMAGLVAIAAALLAISVDTLYQKRFCSRVDLRSGAVIQFAACALI